MWSHVITKGAAIKRVGIREFRDHATQYLAGDEVLAIERHGQPVGLYIPTGAHRREEDFRQALDRLEETVEHVLAATGMTEEELSRLFDLNQPLPEKPQGESLRTSAGTRAPGS